MYLLLKMVMFHRHVSFQGCNFDWIIFPRKAFEAPAIPQQETLSPERRVGFLFGGNSSLMG